MIYVENYVHHQNYQSYLMMILVFFSSCIVFIVFDLTYSACELDNFTFSQLYGASFILIKYQTKTKLLNIFIILLTFLVKNRKQFILRHQERKILLHFPPDLLVFFGITIIRETTSYVIITLTNTFFFNLEFSFINLEIVAFYLCS